jgi:hypothetical protein
MAPKPWSANQRRRCQDHPRGRRRRRPAALGRRRGRADQQDAVAVAQCQRPRYREIDFDTLSDVYVEQVEALAEGGVDFVLIETVFDTLNAKAAIHATKRSRRTGRELPIMLSMTITDLPGATFRPFDRGVLGVCPPCPAAVGRPQLLVRRRPARPMSRRSPRWPTP